MKTLRLRAEQSLLKSVLQNPESVLTLNQDVIFAINYIFARSALSVGNHTLFSICLYITSVCLSVCL